MDTQIHGLMLGCALMLLAPSGLAVASHQMRAVARAADAVTWHDIRVSIVCSEGNPLARVCSRLHGFAPRQ